MPGMARSHHRKKHKHFQPPAHNGNTNKKKGSASTVIAISVAFVAFVISYFASSGNWIWVISIAIAGAVAGYFIGKNIDKNDAK